MTITDRIWGALTAMVRLEDKVAQQSEVIARQQARIENLTERLIRVEAQLELFTSVAVLQQIKKD